MRQLVLSELCFHFNHLELASFKFAKVDEDTKYVAGEMIVDQISDNHIFYATLHNFQ